MLTYALRSGLGKNLRCELCLAGKTRQLHQQFRNKTKNCMLTYFYSTQEWGQNSEASWPPDDNTGATC